MSNKYLFLYHVSNASSEQPSPEQMQEVLARWAGWKARFADAILDLGDGLKPGGRLLAGGVVTDAPSIEAKEVIGGYSIVQSADYAGALEVAKSCPMSFVPGCSIEIRELAGYG